MTIRGLDGIEEADDVYFYAEAERCHRSKCRADATLRSTPPASFSGHNLSGDLPETIAGVLQVRDGYFVIGQGSASMPEGAASSVPVSAEKKGFEQRLLDLGIAGWLILAFLGGFILNIMPCVLPVLCLKVFSLLKHTGQSRAGRLNCMGWPTLLASLPALSLSPVSSSPSVRRVSGSAGGTSYRVRVLLLAWPFFSLSSA